MKPWATVSSVKLRGRTADGNDETPVSVKRVRNSNSSTLAHLRADKESKRESGDWSYSQVVADDNILAIILADYASDRLTGEHVSLLEDSLTKEVDKVPRENYVPKFLTC